VQLATNQSSENLTSSSAELKMQASIQDTLNGYIKENDESRNIEVYSRTSMTGLSVIPVKVMAPGQANMVKTYAFLDISSNTSCCSEELIKQLGLSGRETSLSMTTMEKENSQTECLVVSLEVLDIEEENIVKVPVVFTRPKLPVSVETAAKQEDNREL